MSTPVYNSRIPEPSNSIAQGQPDFLNNFSTLYTAFSQDHIPLDAVSNSGNHTFSKLTQQNTGISTTSSEIALYSKLISTQTNQIFFRTIGNGPEIQYSNYQIYPVKATSTQTSYFTFLPGGIIIYFGIVTPNANTFDIILDPVICTNIFGVNLGVMGTKQNYPMNPQPLPDQQGKYNRVQLKVNTLQGSFSTQSYIIYGGI